MRLDKYLKVSRLIKRRTVANEACDNGRISVNGRVVKASYDVKEREARVGRNPRTKETVSIAATRVPVFKPSKALKDIIMK